MNRHAATFAHEKYTLCDRSRIAGVLGTSPMLLEHFSVNDAMYSQTAKAVAEHAAAQLSNGKAKVFYIDDLMQTAHDAYRAGSNPDAYSREVFTSPNITLPFDSAWFEGRMTVGLDNPSPVSVGLLLERVRTPRQFDEVDQISPEFAAASSIWFQRMAESDDDLVYVHPDSPEGREVLKNKRDGLLLRLNREAAVEDGLADKIRDQMRESKDGRAYEVVTLLGPCAPIVASMYTRFDGLRVNGPLCLLGLFPVAGDDWRLMRIRDEAEQVRYRKLRGMFAQKFMEANPEEDNVREFGGATVGNPYMPTQHLGSLDREDPFADDSEFDKLINLQTMLCQFAVSGAVQSLALLNCANVEYVKRGATNNRAPRKSRVARIDHHELVVRVGEKKVMPIMLSRDEKQDADSCTRHHVVRGHFRRFDRPGSISAQSQRYKKPYTWVRPHVRGDAAHGKVVKEYKTEVSDV